MTNFDPRDYPDGVEDDNWDSGDVYDDVNWRDHSDDPFYPYDVEIPEFD